jgi:hypothetical protein
MRSQGKKKRRRNLHSVISKTARLLDRMARVQHISCSITDFFETFFSPLSIYRIMLELHRRWA